MEDVNLSQQERPEEEYDRSVRLELQADCLAGIWAHSAVQQQYLLETGDLEAAMSSADAVGDDRLQKAIRRHSQPGEVHARQSASSG